MKCPVCRQEGADEQPVGPSVTVFCCPSCLATVLQNFARHAPGDRHSAPRPPTRV
jgi:hypothetical protein